MGLCFHQFGSELLAWANHEGVAFSASFQGSGFDAARTIGNRVGGDVGEDGLVQGRHVPAGVRRE